MFNADIPNARRVLALDAATCVIAGLVCSLGAPWLTGPLDLPQGILLWSGLLLFPVAGLFAWMARTPSLGAEHLLTAAVGNMLWSAASVTLLILIEASRLGIAFVLAQAIVVALFAILEARAALSGPAAVH